MEKLRNNKEKNLQIKNKLLDFFKQPLIYVLLICIIFQLKMYDTVQESILAYDSVSYIEAAKNIDIFHGQVDEKRTPVYPYLVKMILNIGGEENLAKNVAIAQKYLFILTLLLFYYCVKSITKNKIVISIITLIFGICPFIIFWNVPLLTESVSILEVVILSLLTIQYLKKPRYILSGSIGIIILIMIMTRPSFIYVLPIYILFWILRFFFEKTERKKVICGLISCFICCIMLLIYCSMMNNLYGEFALTRISNLNNVVSVVKSNAYKVVDNTEMVDIIDTALEEEKTIWDVYEILYGKYDKPQLEDFANTAIKSPEHLKYLIRKSVELGNLNIGYNYAENANLGLESHPNAISYRYIGALTLPITFGFVYFMLAISIVYLIWKLVKDKQINWFVAFFTSLIAANIFTLIVGAPEEEQRLFSASISLVLLFIAYVIENMIKKGRKIEK